MSTGCDKDYQRRAREDERCLAATSRGDRCAFAQLYDRHFDGLFSVADQIVRNREDAQELVQEVFAEVWRRPTSYDSARGTPWTWLRIMVRSRALDRLRRARVAAQKAKTELAPCPTDDVVPSPFMLVHQRRRTAAVRTALDRLPLEDHQVLDMMYFRGLSQREVADRLDRPIGTVKSRIRAAKHRLARQLRSAECA